MTTERDDSVRDDVFSKAVRAGKRTYFFDVKATRGNDLYITITESKKRLRHDGSQIFEKHKIFLYKEDFEKFAEGLSETIEKLKELREGDNGYLNPDNAEETISEREYTDITFDDLET